MFLVEGIHFLIVVKICAYQPRRIAVWHKFLHNRESISCILCDIHLSVVHMLSRQSSQHRIKIERSPSNGQL